ncbi:MAG: pyridoxal phosphate-dependent aminotransferase [Bacteroidota bacterium]|nr:pyridoxal phosphate-dependent aminotransferase [Bacteroidota bacterium]
MDLTESNPTRCGFDYPQVEILEALSNPENLLYQPDQKGLLKTRITVTDYYSVYNIEVNPQNIFLTSSTSEAYTFIFRLLMNVGDEILVPKPSYPLIEYLAQINDVDIKYYHILYDGEWHIDFESIKKNISKNTKAILLIHPNNPTGSYIKKEEYKTFVEICASHNLALIADEVFLDYSFYEDDSRVNSFADKKDVLTFSVSGISKILGLPQMKLAWIVVSGEEEVWREASSRLEVITDSYLSVSTPIQNAAQSWFDLREKLNREIRDRVKINFEFLIDRTRNGSPVKVLNVEGGWNAILKIPQTKSDEEWVEYFLTNHGVVVQPGYFYDFDRDGFIVVSLLTDSKLFQKEIDIIVKEIMAS